MKKIICLSLLVGISGAKAQWMHIESDSGVSYRPYAELVDALEKLATAHPNLVEHVSYGKSAGGNVLSLLRISDAQAIPQKERYAVEISGAIHGDEYLGIELDLITQLVEARRSLPHVDALLSAGGVIYGIPVVNPDGYIARERTNKNGYDLNRDFDLLPTHDRAFTQPETRNLAQYLDQDMGRSGGKLKFSLDYHCCRPSLIVPWSYEDRLPSEPDLSIFKSLGELGQSILGFPWGNPQQMVGYTAENSSLDYFYAKYGTYATAIEGRYKGEKAYLSQHLQFIDQSLAKLLPAP